VTEGVVDRAQVGDVEEQYRHHLAGRLGLDRLVEGTKDPSPVGQTGERVVVRVEAQAVDQS
jgi:hypothetical protein